MYTSNKFSRRNALVTAVSLALGTVMVPQTASATQYTFNWTGYFIMLDNGGAAMGNTSIPAKGNNQFQTPISGTLIYDDVAGTGSMTVADFNFFSNAPSAPAQAQGISLTNIGSNLMLANMLFNWNGTIGIPVSAVFDATGLLNYLGGTPVVGGTISGVGATPASDGTYINATLGYLHLGASPVVTTAYNTTNVAGCSLGSCLTVSPSGKLPLVVDIAANPNDYVGGSSGAVANTGGTIGGNPMQAGPFQGANATFDLVSMVYTGNNASPVFTAPANIPTTVAEQATPTTAIVNIGTVANEPNPGSDTVEYRYKVVGSNTWSAWATDSGGANVNAVNNVTFNLTKTVNTFDVQWRVTTTGGGIGLSNPDQTVTITITDTHAPVATFPADITVSVNSTADTIAFEGAANANGAGVVSATDAIDPAPTIEWSLDNLNWTVDTPGANESSASFAAGANTVYWRVFDATGNTTTHQQIVTVNLPTGIVGQPCTVDTELLNAAIGTRQLKGSFTMRDSKGNLVGTVDPAVTGTIDSSVVCTDVSCTNSGATLASPTPFYGSLWTTSNITLFNNPATSTTSNTYTFETCPSDGSSLCTAPDPLSMTVPPGEIGAHMLFDWNINKNIDVVVVWKPSCGAAQLVSTDPDGDGIIGTQMVDGPFKGMNAAFDLSTVPPSRPLTTGGYAVTVPTVNNPVANTSPIAVDPGTVGTAIGGVVFTGAELTTWGASADTGVVTSCAGGCFDFSVSGRATGETIQVVLPQSAPIPWYSLYRKYHTGTNSWSSFATTATDNVKTAPLDTNGRCPEPGAGDYTSYSNGVLAGMLRPGDQCVQLTITDNGPNDSNPANGVIADPSGVGVTSGPAAPTTVTSGGGSLDPWMLGALLAWFGRRRKAQP
jgi:hypothetical protein